MSKKLEVTVTDSGVQFGGAWFSHESITGYTAEQLYSGDCLVTGNQYIKWLSQDAAKSELSALREELDASKQVLEATRIARDAEQYANEELREKLKAAEQRNAVRDIESAAKVLANCMDYPWEHMPENGRALMRKHAKDVIDAALGE